jgi:hypothetical protein
MFAGEDFIVDELFVTAFLLFERLPSRRSAVCLNPVDVAGN